MGPDKAPSFPGISSFDSIQDIQNRVTNVIIEYYTNMRSIGEMAVQSV